MSLTTIVIIIVVAIALIVALSARSGPKVTQITTRREKEELDDA